MCNSLLIIITNFIITKIGQRISFIEVIDFKIVQIFNPSLDVLIDRRHYSGPNISQLIIIKV